MEDKKGKPKKKEKQHQQKEMMRNHQRLQGLNQRTLPRSKTLDKNGCCALGSSSASTSSMEGPKGFFTGCNPSSSSSHLKHPYNFQRKPKFLSENFCPKKPLATLSKKESAPKCSSAISSKKPLFLHQLQPGKKPTSKASQIRKLSAGLSNPLKNPPCGSEKDEEVLGELSDSFSFRVPDNLVAVEKSTPAGKLLCGSRLNFANIDDNKHIMVGEDSNSGNTTVKTSTPPVEVSVSPEIQSGSYVSAVANSTLTPICYGAGHLISGVTDKRKCRSKGILTVRNPTDSLSLGTISSCEDGVNENADNVRFKSRNSLIPLPAEASVNWSSSPVNKGVELEKSDFSDSSRPLGLDSIYVSSSITSFCQISSDLLSHDSSEKYCYENSDATTSTAKTTRIASSWQGLFDLSSGERELDFSATPQAKSIVGTTNVPGKGRCSYNLIGMKSPASVDVSSSSNNILTPNSNISSENQICMFSRDTHGNQFNLNQDAAAQDSPIASLSPKCQNLMWHPSNLYNQLPHSASTSDSIDIIKLGKDPDASASWISDSTLENMSLSHMRISWKEALASQTFDMDEFDCCRCLSDEENCDERSGEVHHKAFGGGNADSRKSGIRSPEFLEQEPEILRKGGKILSPSGSNICAESISTDASGLMASRDSDWSLYDKNISFQV